VCSFVLSQSTHVMDGRTDRQIYDPQDRASTAVSRGKNDTSRNVMCMQAFTNKKLLTDTIRT